MEKELLKKAVRKSFLSRREGEEIYNKKGNGKMSNWIFDFRISFCDSQFLDAFTTLFIEKYKQEYPFQICGLETASLPLLGAIAQKMHSLNMPINYFYIRKSRKKYGKLHLIEGETNNHKIIIVDDIVNSGMTISKQELAIADIGKKVSFAFCLLAFKDKNYYEDFYTKHGIRVESVFNLDEFKEELDFDFFKNKTEKFEVDALPLQWSLKSINQNYLYVVPKSFPFVYESCVYFGRDDGSFICVDSSGKIVWSYLVPFGSRGKKIFSSPIVYDGKVMFGAYDGNVYCLNAKTGKEVWVNFDCDWVGASPDISKKHHLVYVGAEYGFWKKKGGLIAINATTGETEWAFREMPEYTHGSPLVIDDHNLVCCGSNDGALYVLNSKTGVLQWKVALAGAIKHRPGFDAKNKIICVADHGGMITGLSLDGKILWQYKMFFGSYCIPKYYNGCFYVTSFDKHVYCLNSKTGEVAWQVQLSARIFSSVEIVHGNVVVGTNEGKLYMLEASTGKKINVQVIGERVTNKVAYDESKKALYVLDYTNTLFSFKF